MRDYPVLEACFFRGKNVWMLVRALNSHGEYEIVSGIEHATESAAEAELARTEPEGGK